MCAIYENAHDLHGFCCWVGGFNIISPSIGQPVKSLILQPRRMVSARFTWFRGLWAHLQTNLSPHKLAGEKGRIITFGQKSAQFARLWSFDAQLRNKTFPHRLAGGKVPNVRLSIKKAWIAFQLIFNEEIVLMCRSSGARSCAVTPRGVFHRRALVSWRHSLCIPLWSAI